MGQRLIVETSVLVDLEREKARDAPGPAVAALSVRQHCLLFVTFTVMGELAAGVPAAARGRLLELLRPYPVIWCDAEVCWIYGQLHRQLRRDGQLIPTNDLWIAATALANSMAVLTRDRFHFERVPGLDVVGY